MDPRKSLSASISQRLTATILMLALLAGCGAKQQGPLQPGMGAYPEASGYNQFSIEQEVQIGQQTAAEADAQLPMLPANDPVSRYVDQLGKRLAARIPAPNYPYSFKVINQKEINAFALPGGPVRINVGTIVAADNESELAGVMAHEIAHVYMRHATRNASKASLAQIPAAILGGILGGGAGGQLARLGLGFGLQSVFLKYSRDAENEADRVGAKIMYESGFDPKGMVSFFRKLEEEGGGSGGPQFLASHPNPGNRAQAVTVATSELPDKNYAQSSASFRQIKALVAKMKPLSAEEVARRQQQQQARVGDAGSIAPSGRFKQVNHSIFQIQAPDNWEVIGDNNSPVTIAPRAGLSQNAIAYGVVISGYQPQQQESLEQSVGNIYQTLRQSNPQIQISGQPQDANIQGLRAISVGILGPSPLSDQQGNAVTERNLLVAVQRQDGSVLWLLFIAPEAHFNALTPTYQQMLSSLRIAG